MTKFRLVYSVHEGKKRVYKWRDYPSVKQAVKGGVKIMKQTPGFEFEWVFRVKRGELEPVTVDTFKRVLIRYFGVKERRKRK